MAYLRSDEYLSDKLLREHNITIISIILCKNINYFIVFYTFNNISFGHNNNILAHVFVFILYSILCYFIQF